MPGRYLLALLLTLVIEAGVAWLLGFRTRRFQLALAVINCMTNPALNYLLLALAWCGVQVSLSLVAILEIPVIGIEGLLLGYVFGSPKGRFWILSLTANAVSFLAGVLIFWR
jgi:hypothetical protein